MRIIEVLVVLFYMTFSCKTKKLNKVKRDDFLQYDPPNLGNNMGYANQFESQHVQMPFEPKSNIPLDSNQELINEDDQSNEIPIGPLENLDGPKVEGNVRLKDLLTFIRKTNIPENPYETVQQQTPQQDQLTNKYNTNLEAEQPQNLLEMLSKKIEIPQEKQWPAFGRIQNIQPYFQSGVAPVKKGDIPRFPNSLKNQTSQVDAFAQERKDKIEDVESTVDSQMKYNYEAIYGRSKNSPYYGAQMVKKFSVPKSKYEEDQRPSRKDSSYEDSQMANLNVVTRETKSFDNPTNNSISSNGQIVISEVTAPVNMSSIENSTVQIINSTINNDNSIKKNVTSEVSTEKIDGLKNASLYVNKTTPNLVANIENTLQDHNATINIQRDSSTESHTELKEPLSTASMPQLITAANTYANNLQYYAPKIPPQLTSKEITTDNNVNKTPSKIEITSDPYETFRRTIAQKNQDAYKMANDQSRLMGNHGTVMQYVEKPVNRKEEIPGYYSTNQMVSIKPQYKKTEIPGTTIEYPVVQEKVKKTIVKNIDPNEHLRDISAWKLIEELNKMKKSTIPQMLNMQQFKKTDIEKAPYPDSFPLILNKYPLEGHVYKKVSNDVFKRSGIPLPVAHTDSFPLVLRMRPAEGSLTREHIATKKNVNSYNYKQLSITENHKPQVANAFFNKQGWQNNNNGNPFILNYPKDKRIQEFENPYSKEIKKLEMFHKQERDKTHFKNYINMKRSRIQYPEQLELNNPSQDLYQPKKYDIPSSQMFTQATDINQPDDNNKYQTTYTNQEPNTTPNNDQEYNLIKSQIMNNEIEHLTSTPIGDDAFQNPFSQTSQNLEEPRKNDLETYMAPNNQQVDNYQNAQEENSMSENQNEAAREMLQKRGQIPKPPSYFQHQIGKIDSYPLLLRRYPAEGSMNMHGRSFITTTNNTSENQMLNSKYYH